MNQDADRIRELIADALEQGAAGRLGALLTIQTRPEDAPELDDRERVLGETAEGRVVVGRLRDGDAPSWWDSSGSPHTLDALCGLMESTFLAAIRQAALRDGVAALVALPVPECSRHRTSQLAILYRAYSRASEAGEPALRGALDRCVADLYGLPLSLLIKFEHHVLSDSPSP